jgi:hypothetical protein
MSTKYIYHFHPFLIPTHLSLVPIPGKDLVCSPASFFKKCILIVQEGFALVLQACLYHALIKLHYLYFITMLS